MLYFILLLPTRHINTVSKFHPCAEYPIEVHNGYGIGAYAVRIGCTKHGVSSSPLGTGFGSAPGQLRGSDYVEKNPDIYRIFDGSI